MGTKWEGLGRRMAEWFVGDCAYGKWVGIGRV